MTAGASLPANGQDTPKDPEKGRGHHENRPKSPRPEPRTTGHPQISASLVLWELIPGAYATGTQGEEVT